VNNLQRRPASTEFTSIESKDDASPGAHVVLAGLTKDYGRYAVVDHLDLVAEPGEFFTLLGPSGSGKTTTLMMIAGFVTPTAGKILLGDRNITAEAPYRRNIGVVFQNYALFPHMTVFDNIAFPLRMRRLREPAVRADVNGIIEMVRLEGLEARNPLQLSGGQQQRVALARALVYRPPLLLMDEPLSALDKKLRTQMQLELKRIQRQTGVTVIYVTHDQEEALTMSHRVGIMNHGKLEQVGTPQQVYGQPLSAFVADFLGDSNSLSGVVEVREGVPFLQGADAVSITLPRHALAFRDSKVRLVIRPEHVRLDPAEDAGTSHLQGIVQEVSYRGQLTYLTLRVGTGLLTATIPSPPSAELPSPGVSVRIGWPAEAIIVLKGDV
jgi:putative spermidine/putrescine transport system ATP-binding protein/spermidine/putrescine transport system ATP-binding protein